MGRPDEFLRRAFFSFDADTCRRRPRIRRATISPHYHRFERPHASSRSDRRLRAKTYLSATGAPAGVRRMERRRSKVDYSRRPSRR